MSDSRFAAAGSLALGSLVLIALGAACQEPRIPAKRSPRPAEMTSEPMAQRGTEGATASKPMTPLAADAAVEDASDDAEPDAGIDDPGTSAIDDDDALPGSNVSAPDAGQGGSSQAGTGGASGADPMTAPVTAPDPDAELIGSWSGHVVDVLGPMMDLCMKITQVGMTEVAGTTAYSNGTNCGGRTHHLGRAVHSGGSHRHAPQLGWHARLGVVPHRRRSPARDRHDGARGRLSGVI
jgi:hypothetical protein